MEKIKNRHPQTAWLLRTLSAVLTSVMIWGGVTSCNDDPDAENYYTFTGEMVSNYLDARSDIYSDFIAVLHKSDMYGMMATYGTYTCFAPTNDAFKEYFRDHGYKSVDDMSKAECDTLAWNHIVRNAYFTTDLYDGNIPTANMNDRYLTFSCDSDVTNNNNVIYYINKASQIIVRDDSVENGVVHTLNRVIQPSADYLPERIGADENCQIFYQALLLTGMRDSLYQYIDNSYHCGEDSVNRGFTISTGGSAYKCLFVGTRRKRYSAFVETDAVYAQNGINNIDDLKAYAKEIYDAVYPQDAGLYDDDFTNRKNPLNRFISYHLLPYYGAYNDWTIYGELKETCAITSKIDCTDWYTTLMPGTIIKFSSPTEGLFINRRGVGANYRVKGIKVLSPSEMPSDIDQQALNGIYHYIDGILAYDVQTRDVVFNDRIRIDAITLSPEFMNCGARGVTENATGFKVIDGWNFRGTYPPLVTVRQRGVWMMTYQDCVDIQGQFDVTFKLPPVPQNTYEVRFAYGVGTMRGVVQVYFGTKDNMQPMGIPIDFRIWGADPSIGWVADTGDEDADRAIDKAMHNRGFMKEMDTWLQGGQNNLREQSGKLRKILTTQTMSPDKEYYVRIKLVLENPEAEIPINYFELCPKSVYAGLTAEDTH